MGHDTALHESVRLTTPDQGGFRLLAIEAGARRTSIAAALGAGLAALRGVPDLREATLFEARLKPPGRGDWRRIRPDAGPRPGRFDVVLMARLGSMDAARRLNDLPAWAALREHAAGAAPLDVAAQNVARIADVPHDRGGVFLFNWFVAIDRAANIEVWHDTAGWFQRNTGLENSTLLAPDDEGGPYALVNHCRWPSLWHVLPHLALRPSFRRDVLARFAAADVAALPVLYQIIDRV